MKIRSLCIMTAAGMILTAASSAHARGPSAQTNLVEALAKIKTENKLLFVQYGRETCGNCQALKAMIRGRKVRLSDSKFVYADVNCDDQATRQTFRSKFKVEGRTLPFVVIAGPDGKQLAARSGYGTAKAFAKFIKDTTRAYDRERKAKPQPSKKLTLPKPRASGIPHDENREMRSWTAASGARVTGALVQERRGIVTLKKEDGTKVQIRAAALSKADRDYLAGLLEGDEKTTEGK